MSLVMIQTELICLTLLSSLLVSYCQEWTWIWGADSVGASASLGGPGGRSGSSVWTDSEGMVWLFGGKGYSDVGEGKAKLLNDLWYFNISQEKWTLEHPGTTSKVGTDNYAPPPRQLAATCGVTRITLAVFGGLDDNDSGLEDTWVYYMRKKKWLPLSELSNYTAESKNNVLEMPSARGDMASWCRVDGMYVFGGMDNSKKIYQDMWKFSMKELKWYEVKSSTSDFNDSDIYPPGRNGATTWINNGTVFYMFGGNILNTNIRNRVMNTGYTSDMWRYFVTNNTWEFLRGYRHGCQMAQFGKKKQFDDNDNHPGCRRRAAAWTDSNMNLWMYGGDGTDDSYPSTFSKSRLLEDLWLFCTKGYDSTKGYDCTKEYDWIWFGGRSSDHNGDGDSTGSPPGGRYEAMYWAGPNNKFYLMGGLGHDRYKHDGYLNDVWMVDLEHIVNSHGVPGGLIVIYLSLALALVLTMTGIFLYARDRTGSSVWSRLDNSVKYSQLTTTAD